MGTEPALALKNRRIIYMHILKTQGLSDSDKAARPTRKPLHSPDSTPKTW